MWVGGDKLGLKEKGRHSECFYEDCLLSVLLVTGGSELLSGSMARVLDGIFYLALEWRA